MESLGIDIADDAQNRPTTLENWHSALASGGDIDAGRRVFYSSAATCSRYHQAGGLRDDAGNATLGVKLRNVSESVDRDQNIRSILRPSERFAPRYQAWTVLTVDGRSHTGLQMDHKNGGAIEMLCTDGFKRRFEANEIDEYRASDKSVMPDGLETSLTLSELRDLIAFLASKE